MVTIYSRASWGARRPDGNRTLYGLAEEVFLHHSVTTHLSPNASVDQERAQMRNIEAIGYSRFGPSIGISYNVVIFPSGRAYQGVSWNRRGAHTDGRNSTVRSICFAGNYEDNEPTPAQLATAAAIYAAGKGKWWKSSAPVRGHRDIKSTACPGRHVYKYRDAIRSGAVRASNPVSGGGHVTVPNLPAAPTPPEEDMTPEQAKKLDDIDAKLTRLAQLAPGLKGVGSEGPLWPALNRVLDGFPTVATNVELLGRLRPGKSGVGHQGDLWPLFAAALNAPRGDGALDPQAAAEAIAEALPDDIAERVADVLATRLSTKNG